VSRPYLYRTRITHLRRAPVHHYFEHTGYSWYVDLDQLPNVLRWLRPFARFDARDHLDGADDDSLRTRVEAFLRARGVEPPSGRITALLQARVLGHEFNPVTLFWCHDDHDVVRHVVMEMHNTRGGRHAYLLPPGSDAAVMAVKKLRISPFHGMDGYYLVRAPLPDEELNVAVSLHRDNEPAFVATIRGIRKPYGVGELLRLQAVAPMAPAMAKLEFRLQNLTLWLRRVPVVSSVDETRSQTAALLADTSRTG
jgi:DUF1365 family protein